MTLEQIKGIYTGRFTNWKQIDGTTNLPIKAYSRNDASGTVKTFQEKVLGNNASINWNVVNEVDRTTNALEKVRQEQGAIYFASSSDIFGQRSQCNIKPLSLRLASGQEISPYEPPKITSKVSNDCPIKDYLPNENAFRSGSYPLTRKIYVIINRNGRKEEKVGQAYVNLLNAVLTTSEGQELIKQAGFVALPLPLPQ